MKKLIIIVIATFGVFLSINAQDDTPKKFGIRAGWHNAVMYKDGAQMFTTGPLNTFYVGIFKEKKLVPVLHIGSGLEYFQNGFQSEIIDLQRKLHYLSVPLYLKVKLGPFYATGGTAFNFKVAEKNKILDETIDPLEENRSNIFDLPLQAGIGLQIAMFSIEARYNWGMLNVNDDVKNQYLHVGFAMSF